MNSQGPRSLRAAAITIVGFAFAVSPHGAQADPSAPKTAAECRALTDFTERGLCWDALDREGLHDDKIVKKRNFGLGLNPLAALKPAKGAPAKKRNPDTEEINDLTLTIASVDATALGRIMLTSTDGAVWEQTDSDAITNRPEPGDTFQVSKGMMGGYMCSVTRWQNVRCRRDE